MKKIILLLLSVLSITGSYAAPTSNWDHVYMGYRLGATSNKFSSITLSGNGSVDASTYAVASQSLSNQKITEGNVQVDLGVGHTYGRFYVGGSTFLQINLGGDKRFTATTVSGGNTTEVSQTITPYAVAVGVNFQPGILLNPKILLYSTLGIIGQSFDIDTTTTLGAVSESADKTFFEVGLQYGLGLRYHAASNTSISLSYLMTSFKNDTRSIGSTSVPAVSGANTIYVSGSAALKSAQTILFGVDYDF